MTACKNAAASETASSANWKGRKPGGLRRAEAFQGNYFWKMERETAPPRDISDPWIPPALAGRHNAPALAGGESNEVRAARGRLAVMTRLGICLGFGLMLTLASWAYAAEPRCACETGSTTAVSAWSALRVESPRLLTVSPSFEADGSPLQVVVPEALLNRLLATERTDVSHVRDVIARTDVVGRQTTVLRVQAECRPNDQRAEIHLVLQGTVLSDTYGVTRQAAVNTLGKHGVIAVKPVMFDGRQLSTRRPQVWVDVNNEHVAAQTQFDGVPIFGGIARSTALSTAERLRPQADAETAEHLSAQLGPQFNQEADLQLARFNRLLKDELLSRYGEFWPTSLATRSTDSHLLLSGSWADAPKLPLTKVGLKPVALSDDAVTVRVHESVLNACVQRLPIAGKTFSERELRELFEGFVAQLGGRVLVAKDAKPTAAPALMPMIRFADKNPMRVKIEEGQLSLIVNASVEVAGQTILAQDEITLPMTWKTRRNEWQVDPGAVEFAKADQGLSLVGMVETLARTQLSQAIPATLIPQTLTLPSDAGSFTSLQVAGVEATAGWLTLSLKIDAGSQPVSEEALRPIIRAQSPSRVQPPTDRRLKPATTPRTSSRSNADWDVKNARKQRDPAGWFE